MSDFKWFISANGLSRMYTRSKNGTWSKHIAAIDIDHSTLQYKAYVVVPGGFVNNTKFDDVPSAKHWCEVTARLTYAD